MKGIKPPRKLKLLLEVEYALDLWDDEACMGYIRQRINREHDDGYEVRVVKLVKETT